VVKGLILVPWCRASNKGRFDDSMIGGEMGLWPKKRMSDIAGSIEELGFHKFRRETPRIDKLREYEIALVVVSPQDVEERALGKAATSCEQLLQNFTYPADVYIGGNALDRNKTVLLKF
jgi:hypothetical protein